MRICRNGSIEPIYLKLTVFLIVIALVLSCRSSDPTPAATPVPEQDTPVASTATPEPTAPSGVSGELEGAEYRNLEFSYTILHPEGWLLTESADRQSVQINSDEYFGVIRILVVPSLLTTIPLEDFVDQHMGAVARVSEVEVLLGPALTMQDDKEAVIVAYAYGGEGLPFEEFATFVTHQDNIYLVTVTRSRGVEDAVFTTEHIQFLLGTFRVLPDSE